MKRRCTACNGNKKIMKLGMIMGECGICKGTGLEKTPDEPWSGRGDGRAVPSRNTDPYAGRVCGRPRWPDSAIPPGLGGIRHQVPGFRP